MPYEGGLWRPHNWDDYEIELIDASLDTVGVLDEAVGIKLDWALFGQGSGSLALHLGSDRADDLLTDAMWYLRVYRDGVQLRDWMVAKDDRGYTIANQTVDEYIEIAISPLDMILKDRFCLPDGGSGQFKSDSLPYDDGFKWIVDHVVGPSAYTSPGGDPKSITGFTVAADESAHGTTAAIEAAHKMDLYEFLSKYGPTWDIDWRVRLEKTSGIANQFVFETFTPARGLDKSADNGARYPVLMNDASGEVPGARRYSPRTGFKNVIIQADLSDEVTDATSVSTFGRHEVLSDTNDSDQLDAQLEENARRMGYDFDFVESEMLEVGSESWQIQPGDTVTIANDHLAVTAEDRLVKQVTLTIEPGDPEQAELTFGEYEKGLGDKVKEAGGGGGGADGFDEALLGNQVGATFIPFSPTDPSIITIAGENGITLSPGANAITIGLGNTAVTPGTYGDATHVGQFTVDQQGRITAASSVTISGVTPATHDIISGHSVSGTAGQVVGLSGDTTLALLDVSSGPDATSKILKTDGSGFVEVQRLYVGDGGNYISSGATQFLFVTDNTYVVITAAAGSAIWGNDYFYRSGGGGYIGVSTARWANGYYSALDVDGNITVTGNVDGVDLGAFKTAYDAHVHVVGTSEVATSNTQPTLSGKTDNWAVYGSISYSLAAATSGGAALYYDATGHVNTSGGAPIKVPTRPHTHNLIGGVADAAVSAHGHLYNEPDTPTGTPS